MISKALKFSFSSEMFNAKLHFENKWKFVMKFEYPKDECLNGVETNKNWVYSCKCS